MPAQARSFGLAATRHVLDQDERVIHRPALDHPVQVETEPDGSSEAATAEPELTPAAGLPVARRSRVRAELGEVAVVARGLDRLAERRIDQSVRQRRCPQRA